MYNRGSKRSAKRTTTTARQKNKYRPQMIEELECRQLLTTLYGGGAGRAATYFYATDGTTQANARITIFGNVTAEFIFMHGNTQEVANRDLVGNTLGLNIFSDEPTNPTGSDLFAIYVSQSDINSYISISAIDPTTGALTTFGSGTGFNAYHANGNTATVAGPGGSGSLTLGALTPRVVPDTTSPAPTPTFKADINGAAFGVRPAGLDDFPYDSSADLSAGLRVANGQDLGKFLFDGQVFGQVHVDGSMNMFYAGWILTGDALGASEGIGSSGLPLSLWDSTRNSVDTQLGEVAGHVVPRQNFYIGGDLQNLATVGPIGWDGAFAGNPDLDPHYLSGTDIYVRGRIGQIQANLGNAATVTAVNMDPAVAGFTRPAVYQEELEGWAHFAGGGVVGDFFANGGFPNSTGDDFSGGMLRRPNTGRDAVPFQNDTFASAQILGTFNSRNGSDIIDVIGGIFPNAADGDIDVVDYYGVPLMAGQTVHAVVHSFTGNAHIGIFDPDGRLVASDYNNLPTPVSGDSPQYGTYTFEIPIQFTTDRPGIWRIAIGEGGDADFTGNPNRSNAEEYELILTNVGVMGLGGISVADEPPGAASRAEPGASRMIDVAPGAHQVEVDGGDLGAVYVTGQYNTTESRLFAPTVAPPPGFVNFNTVFGSLYAPWGNLRTLDVGILGVGTTAAGGQGGESQTIGVGIDLNVPNGSVGLVQTRDAGGITELNPSIQANFNSSFGIGTSSTSSSGLHNRANPTSPTTPTPFTPAELSVGRDYQLINAASRFTGGVFAKGGMGTLRADAIRGANQTYINLDTDNSGFDGKSDLIDIANDIDGPALQHGPGGNFRYMRVGGEVNVDRQFGVTNFGHVVADYGQSVSFSDDSGSTINLTPVGRPIANPLFNPLDPTNGPQFFLPQLSTLTYPIRSGGVIVMDVESTGSLAVNSQSGSVGGTAEISRIEVHGDGAAPTRTTRFTGKNGFRTTLGMPFTSQALRNELSVTIGGSAVTDVAYIVGMTPEPNNNFNVNNSNTGGGIAARYPFRSVVSTFGNLTLVQNNTGGEILSVNAATLGTLRSTGPVGVTRTTSIAGNALNFLQTITIGNAYASRDPLSAAADMPVNPTGTDVGTTYPFNGQTYGVAVPGDIVEVVSNAGVGNIISQGIIGSVVANADGKNKNNLHEGIEAPIWAMGTTTAVLGQAVPDASILAVNIGEGIGSAGSGDFARTGIFADNVIGSIVGNGADIRGTIFFGRRLENLTLNNGSLIDANIINSISADRTAARESGNPSNVIFSNNGGTEVNLPSVTINGAGQGIIGTLFVTNNIGNVSVPKGFGILSSAFYGGFSTSGATSFTVGGYGIRDTIINVGNDIKVVNVTGNGKNLSTNKVSGSVRQSEFVRADPVLNFGFDPYSGRALTPINDIHAALGTSQATPVVPGATDTGVIENTRIQSQRGIGRVVAQTIRADLDNQGLPLTVFRAGNSIDTIQTRGVINGLQVTTGRLGKFLPGSNVRQLFMNLSGPLDNLTIHGNLDKGSVINVTGRDGRIGAVNIKRSLNGTIHATQSIGTVTIGKNLNGSLIIDALAKGGTALRLLKVGGTISNGSLEVGSRHNIANVGQIIVGKSLGMAEGDSLYISGTLDRLQVGGSLNANVRVGRGIGTLQARRIGGNVTTGGDLRNLVILKKGLHGNLKVRNHLQNATIRGAVDGNITANNGIGTLTAGTVVAGNTIESQFGSIGTLRINGDLDGSVNAGGQIGQIIASGDLGDGTTPMTITADHLGLLDVGGSIRNGVTIRIRGPIDVLIIDENVDAGAVIQASAVHRNQIHGEVFGSLLIG